MKNKNWMALLVPTLLLGSQLGAYGSDHDDGETDIKGRNVNLTDLYAFREDWQTGSAGDNGKLVLIMNSNPRSLPRQQYFFSTTARYEFHVGVNGTDNKAAARTSDDVVLRFEFGSPDPATNAQKITVTALKNGAVVGSDSSGSTTPIAGAPVNNAITIGGSPMTVYAGLREDPFFFDVEAFFKFRADAAAGKTLAQCTANFTNPGQDFTSGYNVNAIVLRVPIAFLQSSGDTVFDLWETISIPK